MFCTFISHYMFDVELGIEKRRGFIYVLDVGVGCQKRGGYICLYIAEFVIERQGGYTCLYMYMYKYVCQHIFYGLVLA